jgi:Zn-dependent M28 family amino/carboxypeptidase
VSPERIRADVEHMCGPLSPRDFRHPENLTRASEWIADEFRRHGLQVDFQEYETSAGRFRNVVGFRRGLVPDEPVRVIGAHYDVFGDGPGADDNASGVAVLLEVVRTLPPVPPRRSQYFVAFATEEPPFFATEEMGSYAFASRLHDSGIQVEVMLAMDLVGYYTDAAGSQRFPIPGLGLVYPDRGNFVAIVGDLGSGRWIKRVRTGFGTMTDLPVKSFRAPGSIPGVMWSDHWSFRELGLPGLLITDTAFLRYPWYHDEQDTPEKLDYIRMAEVVRGLHAIVLDRDVSG